MPRRSGFDPVILAILFLSAIIMDGVVLYFIEAPGTRLLLGLLVLAPILWPVIWTTRRLGNLGLLRERPGAEVHKRRFVQLRKRTEQLLREVSQLNWVAVDANRGFRSKDEVDAEFEAIKQRMLAIVEELPKAAGQLDKDSEQPEVVSDR